MIYPPKVCILRQLLTSLTCNYIKISGLLYSLPLLHTSLLIFVSILLHQISSELDKALLEYHRNFAEICCTAKCFSEILIETGNVISHLIVGSIIP